jgi:hypothetical protein
VVPLSLGAGKVTFDARVLGDVQYARLGLLASATYETGSALTASSPDERVIAVHAAPRWHLSGPLSVHAAWTSRSGDVTGTTQFVGGGVAFTNRAGVRAGTRTPIEMRFTHVEAVSGPLGEPKYYRDLLEVRIYYRILGR